MAKHSKHGKKKKSKSNTAEMPTMDKKYMAENDLKTLKEAEMIKMDKGRMKECMKMAKKEMGAMSHVMALKDHIKKSKTMKED